MHNSQFTIHNHEHKRVGLRNRAAALGVARDAIGSRQSRYGARVSTLATPSNAARACRPLERYRLPPVALWSEGFNPRITLYGRAHRALLGTR